MLRVTLQNLLAGKRRLAGTAFAVFLGVAFLAGTLTLGDTLRANFDNLFAGANVGTDVVVRSTTEITVDGGRGPDARQRGLVESSLSDRLRAVDGVAAALPSFQGYGQLLGSDGEAVGGNGPPRLAGSWVDDTSLNPYRLVEGRAPRADGEVVVNRGAAKEGELALGDTTTVQTPESVPVVVVGIATFGDADGLGQTTFTAFTPEAAARHITRDPFRASSVLVRAAPGVSQDELAGRVRTVLPAGVEAITGARLTEENTDEISGQFLDMLSTFLVVFAGVALMVAAFSIHNTFSILVTQRSREVALLRLAGATRRQVLASAVAETLAVGLVASLVGLAGGVALAGLLKGLFDSFGFSLPAGGLVFSGFTAVVCLAVGVLTALLAGAGPALRASKVRPLAALRDVAVDRSATRRRTLTGLLVTLAGVSAVLSILATGSGGSALTRSGIGAVLTIVGVVVLGPVVARPAASLLAWPVARFGGITGLLARQNAVRNPRRTAGSATALLVGVGVVVLFTVFASSLKASIDRSVEQSFGGDLVVATPAFGGGGLSPQLAETVARLPEVERATGLGEGAATVEGSPQLVTVADPPALDGVVDLDVVEGSLAAVGVGGLAVSDDVADDRAWRLGSEASVTFADGTTSRLAVAAVYRTSGVAGDYLISRATWAPHAPQDADTMVLVSLSDGVSLDQGRVAIERIVEPFGRPPVQDRDEYAAATTQGVDMMLGIVYALLALAVVIALMGIANTLSLSVHERTRELGLLRAVGQTRRQVRRMVRWEAVVTALFGTLGGTAVGLLLGWALVQAAGAETARFSVPVGRLVAVVAAGALAGAAAALRPSRRATRVDVLRAIATA